MNSYQHQKNQSSELRVSDLPLRITRKFAQLLDPPHARDWRFLAEKLGMTHQNMQFIEGLYLPNLDGSSTLKMLHKAPDVLEHELNLTLEKFKSILKSIGRHDVVKVIQDLDEAGELDDIRRNKSKIKRGFEQPAENCEAIQDRMIDSSNTASLSQCVSCQKRMRLNSKREYHSDPVSSGRLGFCGQNEQQQCIKFYSKDFYPEKNRSSPPEKCLGNRFSHEGARLPSKLEPYHEYCLSKEIKKEEDECSLVVNHETCLSQNTNSIDPHRMRGAVVENSDTELPLHVGICRALDRQIADYPIDYSKKGPKYSSPKYLITEDQLMDYSHEEDVITTQHPEGHVLDMRKRPSQEETFHAPERQSSHSSTQFSSSEEENNVVPWQNLDKTKLKNMSYMKDESHRASEQSSRNVAKSKHRLSGTYPRSRRGVEILEEHLNGMTIGGSRHQKQTAEKMMSSAQSISSPAFLPNPKRKGPKKVFVTFSHDSERHMRHVLSLVKNMKDNRLDVHTDQFDHKMKENNKIGYLENLYHKADFVVIVVSDKYCQVVEQQHSRYNFTDENPIRSLHARFIYALIKKERQQTMREENNRFRLVYFPQDCSNPTLPLELYRSKLYSWDRSGYKDFYFSLREASKVMSKHCAVNEL